MTAGTGRTRLQQLFEPLAPQLGHQRRWNEAFPADHLDPADRENRIAAPCRLRADSRRIGIGIFSRGELCRTPYLRGNTLAIGENQPDAGRRNLD